MNPYHKRFGFYPEAIQCDQIYRNRENINYCKNLGIRLSGLPLGRPKAKTAENTIELKKIKETVKKDAIERIEVERKFGLAKRRYSMGLVMEKLPLTALAAVSLTIIVKWTLCQGQKIKTNNLINNFFIFASSPF